MQLAITLRDNPGRAVTFVGELIREIQELTRNPLGYRIREDIGPSARVATFGKFDPLPGYRRGSLG